MTANPIGHSAPRSRAARAAAAAAIAIAAAIAAAIIIVTGSSASPLVSVYPLPGTHEAPPGTQITFRGLPRDAIGHVVVRGSSSGRHRGVVKSDSDGQGASFLPRSAFTPGERVTVSTSLRVRGARRGTFSFTVERPSHPITSTPLPVVPAGPGQVDAFRSRPDLRPATVTVAADATPPAEGEIFVAPQNGPYQDGPMIVDPQGRLVWFKPFPVSSRTLITDFREQTYLGKPVLTWWQGFENQGSGRGEGVIYDTHYRQVATVRAGNGLSADLHEFLVTPQGDAYLTAVSPVSIAGIHKPVADAVVQEVDIRTGLVLFEWHALDHIPLKQSEMTPESPGHIFDPYHVNSIWPTADGKLIVSMRNTSAIYEIDKRTGRIVWTLGGKASSFRMGAGTQTAFQHNAVLHRDGTLTLFDDGAGPPKVHTHSRGIRVALDTKRMTATLVREYDHSPPTLANFEGSTQALDGGDVVLGWGQQPYISETDASGRQILDARFTGPNSSYRAYRFRWSGAPADRPAVTAQNGASTTTVYVSWNGATRVARWRVLGGSAPGSMRTLTAVPRSGFETAIPVPRQADVEVQALDPDGHVLGTSAVTPAR